MKEDQIIDFNTDSKVFKSKAKKKREIETIKKSKITKNKKQKKKAEYLSDEDEENWSDNN